MAQGSKSHSPAVDETIQAVVSNNIRDVSDRVNVVIEVRQGL